MIGEVSSIRLTTDDEQRILRIQNRIYEETQIVVTKSEVIRLGIRKLEKEYLNSESVR